MTFAGTRRPLREKRRRRGPPLPGGIPPPESRITSPHVMDTHGFVNAGLGGISHVRIWQPCQTFSVIGSDCFYAITYFRFCKRILLTTMKQQIKLEIKKISYKTWWATEVCLGFSELKIANKSDRSYCSSNHAHRCRRVHRRLLRPSDWRRVPAKI